MSIAGGHTSFRKDDGYSPPTVLIMDLLLSTNVSTITGSKDLPVDCARRTAPGLTLHHLVSLLIVVNLLLRMIRRSLKEMFGLLEVKLVIVVNMGKLFITC